MWREMIQGLKSECEFNNPATHFQIEEIEKTFDIDLPKDLKGLLLESNGVTTSNGLWLLWNTEHIKTVNLEMQYDRDFGEVFSQFDHLIFFGDDGGGDYYGYASSHHNQVITTNIVRWLHEYNECVFKAFSLDEYLKYVLSLP